MTEYLAKIKDIFYKHAAIGEPLSYRDKLMFVFNGLGEEYDSFVTSTLNRADKPSLDEIYNMLYTFEYRMEQRVTSQNINLPQANFSTYSNNQRNTKSQSSYRNHPNPSPKQNKPNTSQYSPHYLNNSPSILGKPHTQPFNPNQQWSTKPPSAGLKPQCQIYGKIGHITLNCYHRTNLNYQPQYTQPRTPSPNTNRAANPMATMLTTSATPSYTHDQSDPTWYMDYGATHHFTSEFGQL